MASKPQNWPEAGDRPVGPAGTVTGELFVRFRRAWNVLEYSSVYLALIAMAEVFVVIYFLELPMSPAPFVLGLLTFAIYANDRLIDLQTDATSSPRRTAFVRRYERPLYILAALSYGLAVTLAVLGGPVAFGLTILPGAVWVLYGVNWLGGIGAPFQRLKEILIVNSVLVAATWSLAIVFVPLAFADATLTGASGVLFLYFTAATFVNTEIANVGDIESDRESGVTTVPTAVGVERTRQCLYVVTLLTGAVLGAGIGAGVLTVIDAAVLATGLVSLLGVIALLGRLGDPDRLAVASECTRLPVFVILAVLV